MSSITVRAQTKIMTAFNHIKAGEHFHKKDINSLTSLVKDIKSVNNSSQGGALNQIDSQVAGKLYDKVKVMSDGVTADNSKMYNEKSKPLKELLTLLKGIANPKESPKLRSTSNDKHTIAEIKKTDYKQDNTFKAVGFCISGKVISNKYESIQ
ncbi:Uncharacterised protein [Yersinia mollaretii]|uniref:hypothetical protein n=1 Tax=Yersinia mollaretii TaxID=33060 RepID=UPI0005E4580D|nr:hypothetical protein [Yersinia mollaretii]CNJ75618.1 Uncharacterised protein [Yersinia mollaretii]